MRGFVKHIAFSSARTSFYSLCAAVLVTVSLVIVDSATAQVYQYTNNTAGAWQTVNANLTPTVLTRVNGATAPAPCSQGFTSGNFPGSTLWNAAGAAVELTLTPNIGYQLNITSIQASNGKSGAPNGPLSFRFAYSLNGTTWTQMPTNQTVNLWPTCSTIAGGSAYTWTTAVSSVTTVWIRIYPNGSSGGVHYLRSFNVNGTVVPVTVSGCTDPTACNFNPVATLNDGSCTYPGCTDVTACNYNAAAGCSNGSCVYASCVDPTACNFGACSGACQYIGQPCDDGNPATFPDTWQAGCNCVGNPIGSPFNGIAVREIPIVAPASVAAIDALLLDPAAPAKCYRVYACLSDPLWEIQAMYSNPSSGENWTLTSSTGKFYRHPLVNVLTGNNMNPAFYGAFPEAPYDSWFTIKAVDNTTGTNLLVVHSGPGPTPGTPPRPLEVWNTAAGTNLDINATTSYAGTAISNITTTPTTTGMPDVNQQVLLGQFTTDGTIVGNFNLQFRKMANAGGTIFTPTTIINQSDVEFACPATDTLCHIYPILAPIELLSFTAEIVVEDRVDLVWVTQTEINNELFLIERSPDGVNGWIPVNQMPGAGNSQTQIFYRSFDFDPLEGLNFYRLKQFDTNGEYSYSNIEVVEFHHSGNISVFPNPSNGSILSLNGKTFGLSRYVVRSMEGRIIVDQALTGEDTKELNLQPFGLSQGMYTLELWKKGKDSPQVIKLVIN